MFDSFDQGWALFKKHGIRLSLFFFAICLFLAFLNYLCYPPEFWHKYVEIAMSGDIQKVAVLQPYIEEAAGKTWIITIIQFLMMIGVTNIALQITTGQSERFSLADFKLSFIHYLKIAEIACLIFLGTILLMQLFIVPGFIFFVFFQMAIPYQMNHPEQGALQSIAACIKMSSRNFFPLLGFNLLSVLVLMIGVLCLLIGIYFASILVLFSFLCLYKQMEQEYNNQNS